MRHGNEPWWLVRRAVDIESQPILQEKGPLRVPHFCRSNNCTRFLAPSSPQVLPSVSEFGCLPVSASPSQNGNGPSFVHVVAFLAGDDAVAVLKEGIFVSSKFRNRSFLSQIQRMQLGKDACHKKAVRLFLLGKNKVVAATAHRPNNNHTSTHHEADLYPLAFPKEKVTGKCQRGVCT